MRQGERGSALVEAGFALPIFLLLLLGTADFGRIFHDTNEAIAAASYSEHVVMLAHDEKRIPAGTVSRFYTCPNQEGDDSGSVQYVSPQACAGLRAYVRIAVSRPFHAMTPHLPCRSKIQSTAVVRIK